MTLREFTTKFSFKVDAKALKKLDDDVKKFKERLDKIGSGTLKLGKTLTVGLTAPLTLAGGALVAAASNATEAQDRFEALFEKVGPLAESTAKRLSDSMGMANYHTKELLSSTGDLLLGMDFTEKTALQVSSKIVTLAADLAAFKNVEGGTAAVTDTLNKALMGNTGVLRKQLSILISDKDVEKEMLKIRMAGIAGTEDQIKALATLRLIQEKSRRATGAYAKNIGGFRSQLSIFNDTIKETAAAFGDILLPIATFIIKRVLLPMIRFFRDLPRPIKGVILAIGAIAASIGPVLIAVSGMFKVFALLAGPLKMVFTFLKLINYAALGMAGVWVAAFAGLLLILEDVVAFGQGRKSVIKFVFEKIAEALDWVGEKFKNFGLIVKIALATMLTPVRAFFQAIQGLGGVLGALSMGDFGGAGKAIKEALSNTFAPDVNDAGALIGFGQEARNQIRPTPGMMASKGGAPVSISTQNTITVPEGTPPQLVGDSIEKGIQKTMGADLRRTKEITQSQVAY